MAALNADIPEDLKRRFGAACELRGVTNKQVIEQLLAAWVEDPGILEPVDVGDGLTVPKPLFGCHKRAVALWNSGHQRAIKFLKASVKTAEELTALPPDRTAR